MTSSSLTLPQTAASSSDGPGQSRGFPGGEPTARFQPAVFWLFALLFAVVAWWPLVLTPDGGLHGGDIYTYFFPLKAWYADRLKAGELALWNPLVGHGFPTLGESQTGVFYPFNLWFYRFLSLHAAYNANFMVHYVLAFGFTCHYARRLGLSVIDSLLTAVVFVYGWFPVRSCLEWAIVTGAWMPLALWGVDGFLAEGRRRYLLATQLAIVMQLLAGHFHVAFITVLLVSLYAPLRCLVYRQPVHKSIRKLGWTALALLLACGVAAIQLIPSWELKSRSQRSMQGFGEQQIGYGNIPPWNLSQIYKPWQYYPNVDEPKFQHKHLGGKNTNKIEAHLYFGLVGLGLACAGIVGCLLAPLGNLRRAQTRVPLVWLVIGVVGVLLSTGWWARWAGGLPGFGYFTGPGRYGLLSQLAIAVLAGVGSRTLREAVRQATWRWPVVAWTTVIVASVGLAFCTDCWSGWAGGLAAYLQSTFFVRLGLLTPSQLQVGCIVVFGVLASIVGFHGRADVFAATVWLALSWVDLALVAQHVGYADIGPNSPILSREHSPVREFLKRSWPDARVLSRNQNAISLCGVAAVPVYLGIGPREYFSGPLRLPDDFQWGEKLTPHTLHWLEWSGVTHVLAFESIDDELLRLVWAGHDPLLHGLLGRSFAQPLWLYEYTETRGRAYWVPEGEARLALDAEVDRPSRVHRVQTVQMSATHVELSVQVDGDAVVVLTELMYPGWNVSVDGRPAQPIPDTVMRAVRVGPGDHIIRWNYWPRSLAFGVVISVLSIVSTMVVLSRRCTRKGTT